jgi:hypothetical protein
MNSKDAQAFAAVGAARRAGRALAATDVRLDGATVAYADIILV